MTSTICNCQFLFTGFWIYWMPFFPWILKIQKHICFISQWWLHKFKMTLKLWLSFAHVLRWFEEIQLSWVICTKLTKFIVLYIRNMIILSSPVEKYIFLLFHLAAYFFPENWYQFQQTCKVIIPINLFVSSKRRSIHGECKYTLYYLYLWYYKLNFKKD